MCEKSRVCSGELTHSHESLCLFDRLMHVALAWFASRANVSVAMVLQFVDQSLVVSKFEKVEPLLQCVTLSGSFTASASTSAWCLSEENFVQE